MKFKCPHSNCYYNDACIIIEITKKIPKTANDCSYFATEKKKVKQEVKSKRGRKIDLNKYAKPQKAKENEQEIKPKEKSSSEFEFIS